jgi:uncharacterized membrane protein YidH (DUF202 family)
VRDPGLQAERTSLAWSRTSCAVLLNGVLIVAKDSLVVGGGTGLVACACTTATAVAIYLVGRHRQQVLHRDPLPERVVAGATIHAVAAGVLVLMVTVLGYVVMPR